MSQLDPAADFAAFGTCHKELRKHLDALAALVRQVEENGLSAAQRESAKEIEAYISAHSRTHHSDEEARIFPYLIARGDEPLRDAVTKLAQEHCWLEENWIALGPQLHAIGAGNGWPDQEEFLHNARVYGELLSGHVELEDSLLYPAFKRLVTPQSHA